MRALESSRRRGTSRQMASRWRGRLRLLMCRSSGGRREPSGTFSLMRFRLVRVRSRPLAHDVHRLAPRPTVCPQPEHSWRVASPMRRVPSVNCSSIMVRASVPTSGSASVMTDEGGGTAPYLPIRRVCSNATRDRGDEARRWERWRMSPESVTVFHRWGAAVCPWISFRADASRIPTALPGASWKVKSPFWTGPLRKQDHAHLSWRRHDRRAMRMRLVSD